MSDFATVFFGFCHNPKKIAKEKEKKKKSKSVL
jgi:hypothetical protein